MSGATRRDSLARCLDGELAPSVALASMLLETRSVDALQRALEERARSLAGPDRRDRLDAVRALLREHADACARTAAMLRELDPVPPPAATETEAIAACRSLFDRAAQWSEEASVALCSLGSAELLACATREIVDVLRAWGVLGARRRVLHIGCGVGRVEAEIASEVGEAWGIDVSPRMIAAARRRCAGLANVHLRECSGRDLADFATASFDLVLAVDSFPYLVAASDALAARHVADCARVLVTGGDLVILNYSYRGDLARDARDIAQLAAVNGFQVRASRSRPFRLWDGVGFWLRVGEAGSGKRTAG